MPWPAASRDQARGKVHHGGRGVCHATGWRSLPGETPSLLKCWRGLCIHVFSPPLFSQVSRFLVVNPQGRCSAEEALAHPFFQQYVVEEVRHFSPRGKFKVLKLPSHPGPWGSCYCLKSKPPNPLFSPEGLLLTPSGFPRPLSSPTPPIMVPAQFLLASGKTDVT